MYADILFISFSANGLYKLNIIAVFIPKSAKDNTDKILENKPLTPNISIPNFLINTVLSIKLVTKFIT